MNKCQEWYNAIAKRNDGYKSHASYVKEGLSGEDEFKKRLINLLPNYHHVLDVGCGHGEFTLEMSKYTKKITGGDSAVELIAIGNELKKEMAIENADFIFLHTHEMDEMKDETYDLIYNRRGPTSIYDHKRLLKKDGMIFGIHPHYALDKVKEKLLKADFKDIKIEAYRECNLIFDNISDFAEHLSSMHMSKDYRCPENKDELNELIKEHSIKGRLMLAEERFIITAKKS